MPTWHTVSGSVAGLDGGAVPPPLLPVQQSLCIECLTQGEQHQGKASFLAPAPMAVVHRLPGPVAFRNIRPGSAGVELPKQAVQGSPLIHPGMTTCRPGCGQARLQPCDLLVSELVATDQQASFLPSDAVLQPPCHRYQVAGKSLMIMNNY